MGGRSKISIALDLPSKAMLCVVVDGKTGDIIGLHKSELPIFRWEWNVGDTLQTFFFLPSLKGFVWKIYCPLPLKRLPLPFLKELY